MALDEGSHIMLTSVELGECFAAVKVSAFAEKAIPGAREFP
jgi:hypothetical protein